MAVDDKGRGAKKELGGGVWKHDCEGDGVTTDMSLLGRIGEH